MGRIFFKLAEYPWDDLFRRKVEKEKERRRIEAVEMSRLKTPEQRRDYLRFKAMGGFNKSELDYKYGD